MRFFRTVTLLWLIGLTSSLAVADDLAFITITDQYQANLAQEALGTAYSRDVNRFLVLVSDEQVRTLEAGGLKVEIVMHQVDPDEVFTVFYTDPRPMVGVDVPQLGESVQLGADIYAVRMSSSVAKSLTRNTELTAVALSERKIPIHYLNPVITNLLSQVTDYPTDSLVNLVNQDSIYAMNLRLENFRTRYYATDSILAARDWMLQKFADWGYTDITTPLFYYSGAPCYNIKVVKPGYAEPDKVIVIGGHYDSFNWDSSMEFAPGADDNGSGTTITLEMARILADIPLRKTIIFMPFSAEEVGLVGSWNAAEDFFYNGPDLEVMFNYDMVGFNGNGLWMFEVSSGPNPAYRDLQIASCNRVNPNLYAFGVAPSGGSDYGPFMSYGFNICNNQEEDFNYDGWHTDIDLTSRMDFDFMYEVARMSVASLAIVANSAYPTSIEQIIDQGDGQSLEVHFADCSSEYTYRLFHGPASGLYTDTIEIPPDNCSWIVDGLTDGEVRFFSVMGEIADGYPALYSTESSGTPYLIPRAPTAAEAGPDFHQILIDWGDNAEADFSHYRLYRAVSEFPFALFKDNLNSSNYTDTEVIGQTEYRYKITAVDFDGYESSYSAEVSAYAATFDGGILLVDETRQGGGMPDQPTQEAQFAAYFDPTPFNLVQLEISGQLLERNTAGQYSSIFWIDDDFSPKLAAESEDSLRWYAGYTGNLLFAGFRTIEFWASSPLSSGDFLYDQGRIASHTVHADFDFAGAAGVGGWPDIEIDRTSMLGLLPFIPTLGVAAGGEPIYLYDSETDDPASEGNVCGVFYDSPNGKRVVLAFPLMYLTDESAAALITYAKILFGESTVAEVDGDVDHNGQIDIGDIVYMVDYMFQWGPPPPILNSADVDGTCLIDISDLLYLVDYVFLGGPAPLPGCVE